MTLKEGTSLYIQIQSSLKTSSLSIHPSIKPSIKLSFLASLPPFLHSTIDSSSHLGNYPSLSRFNFIGLSIYIFIHSLICLILIPIHLSIIHHSIFLSLFPTMHPFILLQTHLSMHLHIYLSFHPFLHSSIHLFIHLYLRN